MMGRNNILAAVSHILIAPQLQGVCGSVGGEGFQQKFDCTFNNPLSSVTCSYDGGQQEECSPTVLVTYERFGPGTHTLVMTALDQYGQTYSIALTFRLSRKPVHIATFLS